MIKVHIWMPYNQLIGHTALSVKDRYISFWPNGRAAKKDLKLKSSQPGVLLQSLKEDIYEEGNRQPITIELPKLNEERVLLYLASLEGNLPRYQLARNNCSHIVAKALMEGSQCSPSFTPHAGHYSQIGKILGRGIWTPDQILKFARELE